MHNLANCRSLKNAIGNDNKGIVNHLSTTGRCTGPARYDAWRRQAARPARQRQVLTSFKHKPFHYVEPHVI